MGEKRVVHLPEQYNIEWNRDICKIFVSQFGVENVSLF